VQVLMDELIAGEMQDQVSLETFAQYGHHRMDLITASESQTLSEALQSIADNLRTYQAGHDTTITNIGGGMDKAIGELASERARSSAKKYVILLTDGKPNVNSYNQSVGNNAPSAIDWAVDRADEAKSQKMVVFTVGVGGDVNEDLLKQMSSGDDKYFFADNQPDPSTGEPMYVRQLQQIFKDIGAKRPVRLIQ
jgi:von Willebrand factor type A domain